MEGNNGSMRVMTKLGMTLEGIYRKSMYTNEEGKAEIKRLENEKENNN